MYACVSILNAALHTLPQADDMNKASSLDLHKSNANNLCEGCDQMLSKKVCGWEINCSWASQYKLGVDLLYKGSTEAVS